MERGGEEEYTSQPAMAEGTVSVTRHSGRPQGVRGYRILCFGLGYREGVKTESQHVTILPLAPRTEPDEQHAVQV
jgi:hypothetical protein